MGEAAEVIEMEDQIIVKEFGIEELTAANVALMKKQILEIPETPETKEQYDKAYRYHVDSKGLLPRIEERRKELKAPVLEKGKNIDATAKKAVAMVNPLIELAGSRRAAWEEIKAAEKAEKDRIEAERLKKINSSIETLQIHANQGLKYNRPSEKIEADLKRLEEFEVSAVDFEERAEEAEQIKSTGIAATKTALENRKKFEADQAEAARVKKEQEAEAKRLAEQQAKIDAEEKRKAGIQESLDRLRDDIFVSPGQAKSNALNSSLEHLQGYTLDKDDYQERLPEAEAMLTAAITDCENRLCNALDREELEAEKTRLAEEQYRRDWDEALKINLGMIHEQAIEEHAEYQLMIASEIDQLRMEAKMRWQATEKAREEAAARLKLVTPDKGHIVFIATELDKWISDYPMPDFTTYEAGKLAVDLIHDLKCRIHEFEVAGVTLK